MATWLVLQVSSAPMEIRLATSGDLPAIAAIYDHEVLHSWSTLDTVPRTPEQHQAWFAGHPADRYPVLVACRQAEVLGWASLTPWSPRAGYRRTAEVSVYVDQAARGSGVGGLLLTALIEQAQRLGFGNLLARIQASGEGSLRLHQRAGFVVVGTLHEVGEKHGRLLDVVLLERSLNA